MSRKEEYKLQNEQFLEQLRTAEGIKELPCGILYRVLEEGRDGPLHHGIRYTYQWTHSGVFHTDI